MAESNDTYKTLDLALRVGELLLASGAGAADVDAQMRNVAWACGLRGYTADITFTELSMSHQPNTDEPALIQVRHVRHREIDYEDLTLVDQLVRDLTDGAITRDEARTRMSQIVSSGHARKRWMVTLAYGVMGAGVGLTLGGNPVVTVAAFVAAVAIDLVQRRMSRRRLPLFYQQVAGGLVATLLAVAVSASTTAGVGPSRIVTASIIALLAGVSFMGAIQDALTGYPLTAGARILEAILATAGVIAGVSGGLTVADQLGIGMVRLDPGASVFSPVPLMALGGAIAAAAFAYASYAPRRSLLPIGLVAALSTALYAAVYDHAGPSWSSALAALLVGLVSYPVAGRVRVPPLVLVVPAIVPILPGLSIYRGLSLLSAGGSGGLVPMINAAAIAIALSAGVILGEYLAQPLAREARRLETRLAGPRLVGPITARRRR